MDLPNSVQDEDDFFLVENFDKHQLIKEDDLIPVARERRTPILKDNSPPVASAAINLSLGKGTIKPLEYQLIDRRALSANLLSTLVPSYQITTCTEKHIVPSAEITTLFKGNKKSSNELWTEKYRPKRICDLIGNEKSTLEVLRWIGQWGNYLAAPKINSAPEQCILLISGPPGSGKTSLASIACKSGNFLPVEVNASEERNTESLIGQIKAASNTKCLFSSQRSLFILDEIDGAYEAGLLKLLASLATDSKPLENDNENADTDTQESKPKRIKGKETPKKPYPIVCICNDLYAPALRTLRQHALCIQMKQIHVSEAIKRLEYICTSEKVLFERKALVTLADMYGGDIRSCINCLQSTLNTHGRFTFSVLQVYIESSAKDTTQSVYSVLNQLFFIGQRDKKAKFRYFHEMLSQTAESEKVIQGCFENYIRPSFVDISLDSTCQLLDWIGYYEEIQSFATKTQNYSLFPLSVFVPYVYRLKCSTYNRQEPVKYPKTDYESHLLHAKSKGILQEFAKTTGIPKCPARIEYCPFLCYLIDPSYKFTNFSLLKPQEKKILARIVEIMQHFNLTYQQSKQNESSYKYFLQPPICNLLLSNAATKFLSIKDEAKAYNLKQIISNQIHSLSIKPEKKATEVVKQAKSSHFGLKPSSSLAVIQPGCWFKFNEGLSNAVRRPLRMKDILNPC